MSEYSICLLAFGNLGSVGIASLNSIIDKHPNFRICVLTDEAGRAWLTNTVSKISSDSICFHEPSADLISQLELNPTEKKYTNFGSQRFNQLTIFKWQLLRDSLVFHKELSGALFSDLDVIWFRKPELNELTSNSELSFSSQDGSGKNSRYEHLCSGVMFFQNTKEAIEILDSLLKLQLEDILLQKWHNDEHILNTYVKSCKNENIGSLFLNSEKYVIGFRFFEIFFWREDRWNQMICFHVNYVKGLFRKRIRTLAIENRATGKRVWIAFMMFALVIKLYDKVKKY